ncbi:uncharacterized protein LOC111642872 [Copidosoma floridanum]|uniref:uncharacterized protein LOC111642872 n=1 Tax=Copidosoma floridanum TaxID=29053 RepID=UPI000C6FC4EC|nr:uncharacterized protein LOC111642872 [Copidosoma floridanum]
MISEKEEEEKDSAVLKKGIIKMKVIKKAGTPKIPRKNYSVDSVKLALQAVEKGCSMRRAAKIHGVPLTSMHRFIQNPEKIDCRTGPPTVLTSSEEQDIANWMKQSEKETGTSVSRHQLLNYVQDYVLKLGRETPFKNGRPSQHWYVGFLRRHKDVRLKTSVLQTQQNFSSWYTVTKKYLDNKDLLDIDASQVFMCDETHLKLCSTTDELLIENAHVVSDASEKNFFTSLFMYSASGLKVPPMIMYPYKTKVPKKIEENIPGGWGFGVNLNGLVAKESLYEYITKVFHPWTLENDIVFPVVVYLNGFSSYKTPLLEQFCVENHIELIPISLGSKYIIKSEYTEFFHTLKNIWSQTVIKWKAENSPKHIKREDFAMILKYALGDMDQKNSIIQNWFEKTGLMPFNPEAVNFNSLKVTKKVSDKNVKLIKVGKISDEEQLLKSFEKKLSTELMESFKECEADQTWTGDIKMTGLFEYWLHLKTGKTLWF